MAEVIVITECGERSRRATLGEAARDDCGGAAELIHPLRARGHRVTAARRIEEVLSHLRRRCPDLLVLPVSMLDSRAIPLIESLCPARCPGETGPAARAAGRTTIALYWDQVCPDSAGGPRPFGAGYFVARAADADATCDRLLACLPKAPVPADETSEAAEPLPLRFAAPPQEAVGEPVRVVA